MSASTTEYLLDSTASTTELPEVTTFLPDLGYFDEPHSQIGFEIPSDHDLKHIDALHRFNTLLQRIAGNVVTSSSAAAAAAPPLGLDAAGQHITSEQISRSVVLDLAELNGASASGLERFFAGADMHSIMNYLWIGVVTSLVVLSVVFILFSCYFYRKFRAWKKCNKDIRSHMNNDMYPGGTLLRCGGEPTETAYYQMESMPPCYTIATGLPTYDEALHHQQHFSYGMKFVYPSIAAVHHHPAISGLPTTTTACSWEKADLTLQRTEQRQQQKQQKSHSLAEAPEAALETAAPPPTYVDAARVALLSCAVALPIEKSVSICMGEEEETKQAAVIATTTTTVADDSAAAAAFVVVVA